jgi:hypothetical protein
MINAVFIRVYNSIDKFIGKYHIALKILMSRYFHNFINMKILIMVLLMFLLTSCLTEYRQLDKSKKPVQTEIIALHNCNIQMSLRKKAVGDNADYHLYLAIKPLINDMELKISDIKLGLSAYPSGKECKPVAIKLLVPQKPGEHGLWIPPVPTLIDSTQTLDLKAETNYNMVYSFSGNNHRLLKLDIAVSINGETVKKSLVFKKHTEVELLH